MTKFFILSLVCILSGLMLAACQREQGVQAGNEQGRTGEYQPRSAPSGEAEQSEAQQGQAQQGQEMTGELQRVDMAGKTISVRVDNGMEQTFKFDDNTVSKDSRKRMLLPRAVRQQTLPFKTLSGKKDRGSRFSGATRTARRWPPTSM